MKIKMKEFTELVCVRMPMGRSVCIAFGAFVSIYVAAKGFQYIRKLSGKSSKDSTGAKSTESCSICHKTSASTSNAESLLPLTVCGNCSASICQNTSCAIRLDGGNVWKCNVCHHRQQLNASANFLQSYDWIFERLNQKFSERANANAKEQTEARTRRCCSNVMLDSNGEPVIVPPPLQERIRVREFIEDLLSSMLGGSLDDVCVGRIYENIDYLPIIAEDNQSPGGSYENLRQIVQAVVQEVLRLPEFYSQKDAGTIATVSHAYDSNSNQAATPFDPKKYEDLLATAVINKIVETYNLKKYENSSGIQSGGSDLDSTFNNGKGSSHFSVNSRCSSTEPKSDCSTAADRSTKQAADIIDEIFREKLRSENHIFVPSIEHSDCSSNGDDDDDHHEHLNGYLRNHRVSLPKLTIDDISASESDEIEEEFQTLYTSTAAQESDELYENWMFRRRGEDGTNSSVASAASPIGMLVPSPTEDIRAQIGDRNADEIESDLSENDSIEGDEHTDHLTLTPIDVPSVLVGSKTLIGGKNEMTSFDHKKLIDLLEPGSLVSEQSLTGQSPVISEAKNELLLLDVTNDRPNTAANMNRTQQESSNNVANDLLGFGPVPLPRGRSSEIGKLMSTDENLVENMQTKDFDTVVPLVQISSSDDIHINEPMIEFETEPIDTLIDMNQWTTTTMTHEELNDSLECDLKDMNVLDMNAVELDSLESYDNNNLTTALMTHEHASNDDDDDNDDRTYEPIDWTTGHDNKITNTISDTKTIDLYDEESLNDSGDYDPKDIPGSIAEREHMKWKNAVEFPNNPYSPEALQRRLSQSSPYKMLDIEGLKKKHPESPDPIQGDMPEPQLDSPTRYSRDYYINDAKMASGGGRTLSIGSDDHHHDHNNNNNNRHHMSERMSASGSDNNVDSDSLLVDNVEVVSLVNIKQAIRVDENSPILAKATKVNSLCTVDRDYFVLDADAVTAAELNNLSLQQSDSLSTTISEDSDSVHVYDLSKRETKILRHGIIKLSRNPVGEYSDNQSINQSGHGTTAITAPATNSTTSAIQQFNRKIFEHTKETRKPPISPTVLKSVHLNRNPRKFKMADMQLSSEETIVEGGTTTIITTTTSTTTTKSGDNDEVEVIERKIETETNGGDVSVVTATTDAIQITQNLLESERHESAIAIESADERKPNEQEEQATGNGEQEEQHIESDETTHDSFNELETQVKAFQIEETIDDIDPAVLERQIEQIGAKHRLSDAEIVFEKRIIDTDGDDVHVEIIPAAAEQVNVRQSNPTGGDRASVRDSQVIITNGNSEKSVIEEDVISALPSVRELAKSFAATKASVSSAQLHRPKSSWRRPVESFQNTNGNGTASPSSDSFVPQYSSYHPVAPGYSITARSLSTKFREELRHSTSDDNGRTSPERPLSPVLVPGILKNNVAFFENLKRK